MKSVYSCYASAAFGLEGLVAGELRKLGLSEVKAENGGVRFNASAEELYLCNLKLHFCDRVFIIAAEQNCYSFENLFQLVFSVPWQEFADGSESFDISAKCARSRLMSPRDCQAITKKAIIEKLRKTLNKNVFPEKGASLPVLVSIHSDQAKILINTSGESLSRRGYRTWNGEAPLRETLAAALVELSPWKSELPLYDPCCGTGTILIEAAFMATARAPGLNRNFAMTRFSFLRHVPFKAVLDRISREFHPDTLVSVCGSDIDPQAFELSERHIRQAGMENLIHVSTLPLQRLSMERSGGVFICNPPYGERLSDQKTCRLLYHDLRILKDQCRAWSMCVLSSDPAFERSFGRKANRKRRLYNGRLECTYYIYE